MLLNKSKLYGFFLFLGLTSPFHYLGILGLIFITNYSRSFIRENVLFISVFLLLVSFNYYYLGFHLINIGNIIISPVFILLTMIIGYGLNKRCYLFLVYIIFMEGIVGIAEFSLGVKSFFYSESYQYYSADLFYNRSVWGVSNNSSVFGQKMFIGLVLIHYLKACNIHIKYKSLIEISMLIFIFLSFNRTAMASSFILYVCLSVSRASNSKENIFLFLVLTFLLFFIFYLFKDEIFFQLFRGREFNLSQGEVDLSGRDVVWASYWNFITENLWFGNNSHSYRLFMNDKVYHAHSSYLQLFANNGLIISSMVIFFVINKLDRFNFSYIIPILTFAITQLVIFNNISVMDVILWSFLLNKVDQR